MTTVREYTATLATQTPDLMLALADLAGRYPGAFITRNQVGNLAVMAPGVGFVAWVDVLTLELDIVNPVDMGEVRAPY